MKQNHFLSVLAGILSCALALGAAPAYANAEDAFPSPSQSPVPSPVQGSGPGESEPGGPQKEPGSAVESAAPGSDGLRSEMPEDSRMPEGGNGNAPEPQDGLATPAPTPVPGITSEEKLVELIGILGAKMGQGLERLEETQDPQTPGVSETEERIEAEKILIDEGVADPQLATDPDPGVSATSPSAASLGNHSASPAILGSAQQRVVSLAATWQPAGIQGMDVSSHQPSVNWSRAWSQGSRFAYVKATEHTTYKNPLFAGQYNGAGSVGMYRGAYHFAIPTKESSGAAQANYFVNNGGGWTADGRTLPPLLDIEYNPYPDLGNTCYNFSPGQMVSWIRDFSNTMKARTGRLPMIYTTADWWNRCTGNSTAFADHPLHIARYNTAGPGSMPAGWSTWNVWQYSSTGPFEGDSNVWRGSAAELSWFAKNITQDYTQRVFSPGDVTGDRIGDLITRRSDGTLWVSPGNGRGAFGSAVRIGQGWQIYNLFVGTGDYDGDGRNDFLARHIDGSLWLYSGTGRVDTQNEGYKPARRIGSGGWEAFDKIIGVADVDGDARSDLIARRADGSAFLYSGTGTGGHGPSKHLGTGWEQYTQIVGTRDFDGDRLNDVLVRTADGRLRLLTGTGRGSFAAGPWIGQGWNVFVEAYGGADFNGDGRPDLIGRDAKSGLTFYAGTGKVSEGYSPGFVTPSVFPAGAAAFSAGDFTSDLKPDVLTTGSDGTLWIHRGMGNGRYAAPSRIGTGWDIYREVISPGDFNSDGRPDLLARSRDGGLWFYPGTGQVGGTNEGYLKPVKIGTGWNVYSQILGAGDLTGDGKPDLIARHENGTLWRYDGTGRVSSNNEGYGKAVRIGTGGWASLQLTAPGDFDGSGTTDVLARDPWGSLYLYRGNGNGTFAPSEFIGLGWNLFSQLIGTGDTTGDRLGDLIGVTSSGTVWHYSGTGSKSEGYAPGIAAGRL